MNQKKETLSSAPSSLLFQLTIIIMMLLDVIYTSKRGLINYNHPIQITMDLLLRLPSPSLRQFLSASSATSSA